MVNSIAYHTEADNSLKESTLNKFVVEIKNNTLTESRCHELLNEFDMSWKGLKQGVKNAGRQVQAAWQSKTSDLGIGGVGKVSAPAQGFANRLKAVSNAIESLFEVLEEAPPGGIKNMETWWSNLKFDPHGSGAAAATAGGEFYKLLGNGTRGKADDRITAFLNSIIKLNNFTLNKADSENAKYYETIFREIRDIMRGRGTPVPPTPVPPTPVPPTPVPDREPGT